MFNNTTLKEANDAFLNYTTAATRKTVELQTTLFKDWMSFNKKMVEMSPAKEMFDMFTSYTAPKK